MQTNEFRPTCNESEAEPFSNFTIEAFASNFCIFAQNGDYIAAFNIDDYIWGTVSVLPLIVIEFVLKATGHRPQATVDALEGVRMSVCFSR